MACAMGGGYDKHGPELIIYGRGGCSMCSDFKSQLEAEGIGYRMVRHTR